MKEKRLTKKQIDDILEDCHVDHLYTGSNDYDWTQHTCGEDVGWDSWEPQECETCGEVLVLQPGSGECCHHDIDYASECEGYVGLAEGPMMSYWYPCDVAKDPEGAAEKIRGCSMCIVRVNDTYGLALTGGGMDFSWEICAAYIHCGYLPPLKYATDLPKMAGGVTDGRLVLAGARKSVTVSKNWDERALEKLDDLEKWNRKYEREYNARIKAMQKGKK
jgi:hypothetical protein